jgi:hypothetical protein
MTGKIPSPDGRIPRMLDWAWYVWGEWVTWPWQVHQLRKAGFVRTGWRTWEYPG